MSDLPNDETLPPIHSTLSPERSLANPLSTRLIFRASSIECPDKGSKVDFHKRHIEHLRYLSAQKSHKLQKQEEQRRKTELNRDNLARLVLTRKSMPDSLSPQYNSVSVVAQEAQEINDRADITTQGDFRFRYISLLKNLSESNKQKALRDAQEKEKQTQVAQRLKTDLGLGKVNTKLFTQTVASQLYRGPSDEDLVGRKNSRMSIANSPKSKSAFQGVANSISMKPTEDLWKQVQLNAQLHADKKVLETLCEEYKDGPKDDCEMPGMHSSISDSVLHPSDFTKSTDTLKKSPVRPDIIATIIKKPFPIRDMEEFRKRHRLSKRTKVFIVLEGYPEVRRALLNRDWYENTERSSPFFDLIWTKKHKKIDFHMLKPNQICNHFEKSGVLTTKSGLARSLHKLIWFKPVDINTFYPRCFNAKDPDELDEFFVEFKVLKAESILKQAVQGRSYPIEVMIVAYAINSRRLTDINELIDLSDAENWTLVKDAEWEFLSGEWTTHSLVAARRSAWFESLAVSPLEIPLLVQDLLQKLKEKFPQYSLNGEKSAWITKPTSLSKGRGISCHESLESIKEVLKHRDGMWVIQKYIENPLILIKKKFDIRQWALVTDLNPLTVWFYERCYLRFGVEDYSLENFTNKFVHLTNNSISKASKKFEAADIEGCMWHCEDFADYLEEQYGRDVWGETLRPKIQEIIKNCLECAQDMLGTRKNSCELYGFDLMIDEELTPWLLEVQASPCMEPSTDVTAELCSEVLEDCIKVIVDYAFSKKKSQVDTGNFSLLCKAKRPAERAANAIGLNLVCEGRAVKR
mmetsp:Transcript_6662/g.11767  ORF Transcript_6662/g.11767 Transcript_6662/m.11767 type:complete len:805 (+) Transcript_6662:5468-7882(+)